MSNIIDFKPRKPSVSLDEDLYYDPIVRALQDMPQTDRAIAAACDDDDWKELVQIAAYCLGFAVLPEIKKALEDGLGALLDIRVWEREP